jgi:hypothetical protein
VDAPREGSSNQRAAKRGSQSRQPHSLKALQLVFLLFSIPILAWLAISSVTVYIKRSLISVAAAVLTLLIGIWMIRELRDEHGAWVFFGCLWGWMLASIGCCVLIICKTQMKGHD